MVEQVKGGPAVPILDDDADANAAGPVVKGNPVIGEVFPTELVCGARLRSWFARECSAFRSSHTANVASSNGGRAFFANAL
jgi:hypothetical protein